MTDEKKNWHLSEVTEGKEWSLQELDSSGSPVGQAQLVQAAKPGCSSAAPVPPALRARDTQLAGVVSLIPRSFATSAIGLLVSVTIRTAPHRIPHQTSASCPS
ncbi:hypothetical protein [Streptomyces sp. NPDC002520]